MIQFSIILDIRRRDLWPKNDGYLDDRKILIKNYGSFYEKIDGEMSWCLNYDYKTWLTGTFVLNESYNNKLLGVKISEKSLSLIFKNIGKTLAGISTSDCWVLQIGTELKKWIIFKLGSRGDQ